MNKHVVAVALLSLLLVPCLTATADQFVESFDKPAPYYAYDLEDDVGYGARANLRWQKDGCQSEGCLAIDYSFKLQGKIVEWLGFIPLPVKRIAFMARTDQPVRLVMRFTGGDGSAMEESRDLPGSPEWQKVEWDMAVSPPSQMSPGRWAPGTLAIGMTRKDNSDYSGTLLLDNVVCESSAGPAEIDAQYRAWYLANPGIRVLGERSDGYLYFPGERVRLTVSVRKPLIALPLTITAYLWSGSGSKASASRCASVRLTPENGYSAKIDLPAKDLGYYEVFWMVSDDRAGSKPLRTSLALIPRNPQERQRPESPFGINVHRWWQGDLLAVARRVGIAWIRDLAVAPYDSAKGECTADDEVLTKAEANKLCYLPVSEYFEPNAKDVRQENGTWVFPEAAKRVEAYARRHKGRISHFELYNEPMHFLWGPFFDPEGRRYDAKIGESGGKWKKPFLDFGIAQTQALHRGDPKMKMLWPEIDVFMDGRIFAEAGAKPYMQVLAPHIYNVHDDKPETQSFPIHMPETLKWLKGNGIPPEVWATEVGLSTYQLKPGDEVPKNYLRPQSEQQQADKLARTIILDLTSGIAKTFWYDLYCDGDDPFNSEHNFGIVRYNPLYWANPWAKDTRKNAPNAQYNFASVWHSTFEPKPALVAYANVIHQLTGAKWLGRCKGDGWVFAYKRTGGYGIVAWVQEGGKRVNWRLGSGTKYVTMTGLYGGSRRVKTTRGELSLTLTESPIFVTGMDANAAKGMLAVASRTTPHIKTGSSH